MVVLLHDMGFYIQVYPVYQGILESNIANEMWVIYNDMAYIISRVLIISDKNTFYSIS